MAGQTEAEVRAELDEVRASYDTAGSTVAEKLCEMVIRLAREIDEIRAELESK